MFAQNLRQFISYYGKDRKLKLAGFTVLSLIAGGMEFIGIALIYPFIMMIIQPENIVLSKYIKLENSTSTGLLIGLCVLLVFILKNAYIIFTQQVQAKFVQNWKQSLVTKFMKFYIYAPYKITMQSSANDKFYTIETLCGQVIDGFVMRILNLLTNIIIIFMVILLLMIKFPVPALITIAFVCISMTFQNKYFKAGITAIAEIMAKKIKIYQSSLMENIHNIKEIKILSAENMFYKNFVSASKETREIQIKYNFYASAPPYIIEILVVFSLMLMAYILSLQNHGDNSGLIASFAIVVAALFRIAPALNRIQSAMVAINTSKNFVKLLNNEYKHYDYKIPEITTNNSDNKISFNKNISLKNIKFSYNPSKEVIKNISFDIEKGDFVGIIGLSGAGKSTLADIITGLLPADSGKIFVDNTELTDENFCQFRKIIGYVPQQINILDKSVRENIGWGCAEIDDDKVIQALKNACLYDVINEYPDGIFTNISPGQSGLSQGQKQRLAIARALYRDPEIIILDEATSALDVKIESEITEMLSKIASTKTIIAIAHRLSTLKACNKLIYMKDGSIVDIGTFAELSTRYEDFSNLIKLSKIN